MLVPQLGGFGACRDRVWLVEVSHWVWVFEGYSTPAVSAVFPTSSSATVGTVCPILPLPLTGPRHLSFSAMMGWDPQNL